MLFEAGREIGDVSNLIKIVESVKLWKVLINTALVSSTIVRICLLLFVPTVRLLHLFFINLLKCNREYYYKKGG